MSRQPLELRVENVVVIVNVGRELNLDELARKIPGATYDSSRFPGLIFRIKKPRAAVLAFHTGRMICAGMRSEIEAHIVVKRVAEILKEAGVGVGDMKARIQNIVASANLGGSINVEEAASILERTMYEPDQFPAVIYRMDEPRVTMLIFSSGKIVCAGAKNEEVAFKAIEKLRLILEKNGIIKY
ncbi:MAG: TATA-box-binding protein [Thermofilaceae archaeon]